VISVVFRADLQAIKAFSEAVSSMKVGGEQRLGGILIATHITSLGLNLRGI
jgi:hypothetical protein